jgi:hypothetical protein
MARPILLLLSLAAALVVAAPASEAGGRLHPQGWYLEQFRAWAAKHNVELPPEAGRAFRHRLALWADNKCVGFWLGVCGLVDVCVCQSSLNPQHHFQQTKPKQRLHRAAQY